MRVRAPGPWLPLLACDDPRLVCTLPGVGQARTCDLDWLNHWVPCGDSVYEADPLVCPCCGGPTRILAFIEHPEIIIESGAEGSGPRTRPATWERHPR